VNLDSQFLQPVEKHGVGARPMALQVRMLLEYMGGGLGHAHRARL
jgi:hypothetical protein